MSNWNMLNANISFRICKRLPDETIGEINNKLLKQNVQKILDNAPKFENGCPGDPIDIFLNQSQYRTSSISNVPNKFEHAYFVVSIFGMFRDYSDKEVQDQFDKFLQYLNNYFQGFITYSIHIGYEN